MFLTHTDYESLGSTAIQNSESYLPFFHCSLRRAFKKSKSVHVVKEDEGLPSSVDVMDGSNEGGENLAAFLESIGLQSYHDAIKNELKVMY